MYDTYALENATAHFATGAAIGVIIPLKVKLISLFFDAAHGGNHELFVTAFAIAAPLAVAGIAGKEWQKVSAESRARSVGAATALLVSFKSMGAYAPLAKLVL